MFKKRGATPHGFAAVAATPYFCNIAPFHFSSPPVVFLNFKPKSSSIMLKK
jgi:hypothetical protein